MEDIKYIHFWKRTGSDAQLQSLIDYYSTQPYMERIWLILLEEKLRRLENEISISKA